MSAVCYVLCVVFSMCKIVAYACMCIGATNNIETKPGLNDVVSELEALSACVSCVLFYHVYSL